MDYLKNKKFKSLINNTPNTMTVIWELTTTCNYSCWYCTPELHDGKYKWPDLENSLEFFHHLCSSKDNVVVDLAGGEPTLWPQLPNFLANKPEKLKIVLTTNGSRSINWWKRNSRNIDVLYFSFHPDTADIDHFYNVCKTVTDLSLNTTQHICVSILTYKEQLKKCQEMYNRLLDLPISCTIKFVTNRLDSDYENFDKRYIDQDVKEFVTNNFFDKSNPNSFKSMNLPSKYNLDGEIVDNRFIYFLKYYQNNDFYGWQCTAGINRLYINANGDIFRGTCKNDGKIGNINFDTYLSNIKPTICKRHACSCSEEIRLTKIKI